MTHLLQDEMERLYGRDSVNAMGRFTYNYCFTIIFSQPMRFDSSMHMPLLKPMLTIFLEWLLVKFLVKLPLLSYFVSSEGSGKSVHMHRLA